MSSRLSFAVVLAIACLVDEGAALAADCPGRGDPVDTDRPDVTNSSVVVPFGSLQVENGVDWVARAGGQTLGGPETRIRFGAFRCGEALVDLPNYTRSVRGVPSAFFSEAVISVKRQLFVEATGFSLSAAAGVGVPGGATGRQGYRPYLQFPWSRSIGDGWSANGMVTVTWSTVARTVLEPTLAIERELGGRGDVFAEYIGDYARHDRIAQIVDAGGGWRFTSTQQVDVHVGAGLTRGAPRRYVGVGYSLRIDGLLGRPDTRASQ